MHRICPGFTSAVCRLANSRLGNSRLDAPAPRPPAAPRPPVPRPWPRNQPDSLLDTPWPTIGARRGGLRLRPVPNLHGPRVRLRGLLVAAVDAPLTCGERSVQQARYCAWLRPPPLRRLRLLAPAARLPRLPAADPTPHPALLSVATKPAALRLAPPALSLSPFPGDSRHSLPSAYRRLSPASRATLCPLRTNRGGWMSIILSLARAFTALHAVRFLVRVTRGKSCTCARVCVLCELLWLLAPECIPVLG